MTDHVKYHSSDLVSNILVTESALYLAEALNAAAHNCSIVPELCPIIPLWTYTIITIQVRLGTERGHVSKSVTCTMVLHYKAMPVCLYAASAKVW